MKKFIVLLALNCAAFVAFPQVRFVVSLPSNTPAQDTIFIAGNFNNWNPGAKEWALVKNGPDTWTILMPAQPGTMEFKFTRGSWAKVEADIYGHYVENRTYRQSRDTVAYFKVEGWEDVRIMKHTASPNVRIVTDSFFMPQLNRYRRIWIYLPPDYAVSDNSYPVIYMCDGQNLFEDFTSFAGEWGVDETFDLYAATGGRVPIVVGIDHGALQRLDEYSPWVNPRFGGGEGEAFVLFIANTLKPYIDGHYRTKSDSRNTAILGASMGGLISLYAVLVHPGTFGAAGVFSPSLSFSDSLFLKKEYPNSLDDGRIYILTGGKEGKQQKKDVVRLKKMLASTPLAPGNVMFDFDPEGEHNETLWRQHLLDAVKFLFPPETGN